MLGELLNSSMGLDFLPTGGSVPGNASVSNYRSLARGEDLWRDLRFAFRGRPGPCVRLVYGILFLWIGAAHKALR